MQQYVAVPLISQPGSPLEKQIIPSLFTQGRYLNQVFCDFLTKTTTMTTNLKRRNQQTKIPTSNSRSAIERVNLMGCPQICWCDPITNSDLSRELGWVLQMCINILFDLIRWSAFSNRKPSLMAYHIQHTCAAIPRMIENKVELLGKLLACESIQEKSRPCAIIATLRLNLEPSWVTHAHAHLLLAFIEASKAKSKSMWHLNLVLNSIAELQ